MPIALPMRNSSSRRRERMRLPSTRAQTAASPAPTAIARGRARPARSVGGTLGCENPGARNDEAGATREDEQRRGVHQPPVHREWLSRRALEERGQQVHRRRHRQAAAITPTATIFGNSVRVCSCTCVAACTTATAVPTSAATASIGNAIVAVVTRASRSSPSSASISRTVAARRYVGFTVTCYEVAPSKCKTAASSHA